MSSWSAELRSLQQPSTVCFKRSASKSVVAKNPGDQWQHVFSHDLRRSWATYHLVERQVDVRTMMAVGGWSDYSAIEPYLKEPTEARIGEAFDEAGVA